MKTKNKMKFDHEFGRVNREKSRQDTHCLCEISAQVGSRSMESVLPSSVDGPEKSRSLFILLGSTAVASKKRQWYAAREKGWIAARWKNPR